MTIEERSHLIESLCFLTGKEPWWFEGKTDKELLEMYDRLTKIY